MTVKLKVSRKDICNGQPGDDQRCPLALAFGRVPMFRGLPASVGTKEVIVANLLFPLTAKARRWTNRFDYSLPVKPSTFRLVARVLSE